MVSLKMLFSPKLRDESVLSAVCAGKTGTREISKYTGLGIGLVHNALDRLESRGMIKTQSIPGGQERGFAPKRIVVSVSAPLPGPVAKAEQKEAS